MMTTATLAPGRPGLPMPPSGLWKRAQPGWRSEADMQRAEAWRAEANVRRGGMGNPGRHHLMKPLIT
jgi:hypothetical protein